jgi:hypothetical protein
VKVNGVGDVVLEDARPVRILAYFLPGDGA